MGLIIIGFRRITVNNLQKIIAIAGMTIVFGATVQAAGVNSANMTTFSSDTTALASEVNDNFAEHTTQINDNDARVSANTTAIGNNASDISATNTAVAGKQNQVTGTCAAGSSISAINADGSVTCEDDTDTNTTYSAGAGLTLTDTTFSAPDIATNTVNIDINTSAISALDDRVTILEQVYAIGDLGPAGGWVFYVEADGRHGLEAAPSDQSGAIQWYNGLSTNTEARGDGIGAGEMNTMLIIANQGFDSNSYAAGLCANLVITNATTSVDYGDWYLPSKYELNLMYQNLHFPGLPPPVGVGGFASNDYWSSSEFNGLVAWFQIFTNGGQGSLTKNSTSVGVRAVRAF
jgi:hypothetical protein